MNLIKISKPKNIKEYLKNLGVDSGGVEIINKKTSLHFFEIKNLKTPAVNILKQDALSIGAELAVPSGAILCKKQSYDCLLIATTKQLEILSKKELAQPFGLKDLANEIKKFLQSKKHPLKIMGVINANSDSFYSGSRFIGKEAILQIEKLINDGAKIIDIGAVSSRPGSIAISPSEELNRIKDILNVIKKQKLYEKATFSIDSYEPSVIKQALDSGFSIINDITGAKNEEIIKLAKNYNAKLCIMHMQGTPKTMQQNPTYEDVVVEIEEFFKDRILKCQDLGLSKQDIILDVGIGFGKTLEHNLALLNSMENFTKFGCEILIGASRKSLIDNIITTPIEQRLPGTLIIHTKAVERGANIVRCHDVKEHIQAFAVLNRL
jgi:dihydropteroate synthase